MNLLDQERMFYQKELDIQTKFQKDIIKSMSKDVNVFSNVLKQ